ncbi:MAG: prefoldin subunit beta [Candidatus Micrarchaeota archaeon]
MSEEDLRNELIEFQNLQQQMQIINMQRQQLTVQLSEIEKAKEEVAKTPERHAMYRLVGNVFVPKDAATMKKDLEEEKETLEMRKSGLQKQEQKFTERINVIRKKVEAAQAKEGASING